MGKKLLTEIRKIERVFAKDSYKNSRLSKGKIIFDFISNPNNKNSLLYLIQSAITSYLKENLKRKSEKSEDTILIRPKLKRSEQKDWASLIEDYNVPFLDKDGNSSTLWRELKKIRLDNRSLSPEAGLKAIEGLNTKDANLLNENSRDYLLSSGKYPSEEQDLFTSKTEINNTKKIFKEAEDTIRRITQLYLNNPTIKVELDYWD